MSQAIPQIPREEWTDHPRFPDQTLLLGSHESFRRVSRHLVAQARDPERALAGRLLFERWMLAMGGHEGYEEGKLYPYLEHRWGTSLDALREGHEALHAQREGVREAFTRALERGDEQAHAHLEAALRAHDRILTDHLELEEDRVIPLLLALEPEEFRTYYRSPIHALLRARG